MINPIFKPISQKMLFLLTHIYNFACGLHMSKNYSGIIGLSMLHIHSFLLNVIVQWLTRVPIDSISRKSGQVDCMPSKLGCLT